MANGQWSMVNGQRSMVNGQWSMVNGQMVNGQRSKVNGQRSMDISIFLPPFFLLLFSPFPLLLYSIFLPFDSFLFSISPFLLFLFFCLPARFPFTMICCSLLSKACWAVKRLSRKEVSSSSVSSFIPTARVLTNKTYYACTPPPQANLKGYSKTSFKAQLSSLGFRCSMLGFKSLV